MAWHTKTAEPPTGPESSGLWLTCPQCSRVLRDQDLATTLRVCSSCGHHLPLGAAARLRTLLDDGRWTEHDAGLASTDPLTFADRAPYRTRLQKGSALTGLRDAVITATGAIDGLTIEAVAMEFGFIGGSLGVVGGEKITRAIDRSLAQRRPLVVVCASSGARVMEGTLSLVQMAKVSGALGRLDRARVPYLTVLTDPTTGAVAASLAMLADITVAEPGARIGFAPPQVIAPSGARLPRGFQRSEYLLEHGMVDMVVDRRELAPTLARLLRFLSAAPAVTGASGPPRSSDRAAADSPLDLPLD
jgi:acetyl-CoA carboxylase carboxyl transferase subunit beta